MPITILLKVEGNPPGVIFVQEVPLVDLQIPALVFPLGIVAYTTPVEVTCTSEIKLVENAPRTVVQDVPPSVLRRITFDAAT